MIVESYTSLQAADPEDFKTSIDAIDARAGNLDLPGGRHVGIFLHEVIEKLDFDSFGDAPDLHSWMARDDVRELFASAMRRHGVDDPRWLDRGREIVFNTLTSRVALGESVLDGGLWRLKSVREMEFAYPIPERHHNLLSDTPRRTRGQSAAASSKGLSTWYSSATSLCTSPIGRATSCNRMSPPQSRSTWTVITVCRRVYTQSV